MHLARHLPATLVVACICSLAPAVEPAWVDIPRSAWKGPTAVEVPALGRAAAAAIALPPKEAVALVAVSPGAEPAGLYEIRLTLRPSHTADAVAFHAGLRAMVGGTLGAEFAGQFFARPHEAESRSFLAVHPRTGPLAVSLAAHADAAVADAARTARVLKQGGPKLLDEADLTASDLGDAPALADELEQSLTPESAVYYLVDRVEYRPLSRSGRVTAVATDKIRYRPGETLRGTATVADVGGRGGTGSVRIHLETRLRDRVEVARLPVTLGPEPQALSFEVPLPDEELGYGLVAEFVSADGADKSEAGEYFTIAENFQRVAIFGGDVGSTRDVVLEEGPIRAALAKSRAGYFNAVEYFAWAPDDLLELTPAEDSWFSGQTNYLMHKPTIQRQIRLAHEQGLAMVSYGKWCVSGAPGWEAVYERPADFSNAYRQPIGSWDPHDTRIFDLRRNGEQVCYSRRRGGGEGWFNPWWNAFLGITPNASLALVRTAADEMAASAELFGWDAIRWDGHVRAGWNATGRSGEYQPWAARQTQALVRYFKDTVERRRPGFRHGYNYFLIEPDKGYDWAREDFELDELCRGGGLLMNESIGNASAGWTFAQIARNLQVEGDLCRERGGFYLGISFAKSPRDMLIESALWAAAGCRPYGSAMTAATRRYLTRHARYTLDERLRRLATPEKILVPEAETRLWWQPFVYETPLENGRRQLVVNLLNIPREDKRPNNRATPLPKPVWTMPAGTDPVAFALTLPAGIEAEAAHLIDPWTLAVQPLELQAGRFEVPSVAIWKVLVLDLAADSAAPSLAELYGPPKTLGVKRETSGEADLPEVVIDPGREVWEVNKSLRPLEPESAVKREEERRALAALGPRERQAALEKRRAAQTVESLSSQWWKGGVLPDDLARKDEPVDHGDLAPARNGRIDVFHGRGPMDHRLRLPEALARLDRFRVHDAPFAGSFRGGGLAGMRLADNVPWQRLPEFDLLLYTGIPYAAIGIDTCYALPAYVKAGGAVFFTGGEWAFGKGGYLMTVLDRDVLPVACVEMDDCRTSDAPLAIRAGPDFAELDCPADFAARPSFWVFNQVLLKDQPEVKVFLESEAGPVLVGWQLGQGRVACLLVDHRGKSGDDATAFFDWEAWPEVAAAVIRWLAPDAGRTDLEQPGGGASATAGLADDSLEDLLEGAIEGPAAETLLEPDARGRRYELALAVPREKTPARVAEGRQKLAAWNASERAVLDAWTGGGGFSASATELPGLDAVSLYERLAWLAYLARHDPEVWGGQFVREWLKTGVYQDYCYRTKANSLEAGGGAGDWDRLAACFGRLRDLVRPDVVTLLTQSPAAAAAGLRDARFTREILAARNLLGDLDRAATAPLLALLESAMHPDLAAFLRARADSARGLPR